MISRFVNSVRTFRLQGIVRQRLTSSADGALASVKQHYKQSCIELVRNTASIESINVAIEAGLCHGGLDFKSCLDLFYELRHYGRDHDCIILYDNLVRNGFRPTPAVRAELAVAMCRAGQHTRLLQTLQQQPADSARSVYHAVLDELSDPHGGYDPTLLTRVQALQRSSTASLTPEQQRAAEMKRRTEPQRAAGAATVLSAADLAEFDAFDPETRMRAAAAETASRSDGDAEADEDSACTGHTLCRGPS